MKKIITTLTAVTFALGLAAAAQAQVAKTPEKPAVQSTQEVQPQVAPKEAAKPGEPVAKEDRQTRRQNQRGGENRGQRQNQAGSQEEQAEPKGQIEKKAGAPMEKTPEGAK